jgi:chemotaxis protein MotB
MATKPAVTVEVRPVIIVKRVKKVAGGHHGGAWKVAYADFVTAMMAFFMLLWLLSSPDKERLKGLAEYFSPSSVAAGKPGEAIDDVSGTQPGLGSKRQRAKTSSRTVNGQPSSPAESSGAAAGGTAAVPNASLRVIAEELKLMLQPTSTPENASPTPALEKSREGLRISLMDDEGRSMFRGGTAVLNPYARELLERVARKIARSGVQIAIEGHTDASGGQASSNWKLSSDRALAARDALIAGGLTPDRFSEVVALAGTQPVYPDQPNRPENRRITIVLLAEGSPLPTDSSFRF